MKMKYGKNYMPDKWCVSPYCFEDEVRSKMKLPKKLHIRDSTIREGDETPGVYMTPQDKLKIAEKIYDIGITEIDIGFAGTVEEHAETCRLVKKHVPKIGTSGIIKSWSPDWKDQINKSVDAGCDRIEPWNHPIINHATKDSQILELGHPREELIPRLVELIEYGISQGVKVSFMASDGMRASWDFLVPIFSAVERAGIDMLVIAEDGYASPAAIRYFMSKLTNLTDLPILWHAHNDFGLAVANTLAAIDSGAVAADLIVNGLGDKAGITSTEEVVVSMECLYGVDTGVDMSKLYALSKTVEEITGIKCQPHKAIVGENAFLHESELHAYCIISGIWEAMEAFRAELVGHTGRRACFGDTTLHGEAARAQLRAIGLKFTDDQVATILNELRKALPKQSTLSLEEFNVIARKVIG